jgi:tripartite-type tricarboxylate transporter receptor subunit TctC
VRSEALPDVPVLADFVPDYEASEWYGVGGPRRTPAEIVDALNNAINAGGTDPQAENAVYRPSGMMLTGSPTNFGEFIAEDTGKWAKVIKFSGAKPD